MKWIEPIADRCGLICERHHTGLIFRRGRVSVGYEDELSADSPASRAGWHSALLGVRLALDRLLNSYEWASERERNIGARNVYEKRSQYGERLQRLVSNRTVEIANALADTRLFASEWGLRGFAVIYVREVGKIWHAFAECDFEHVDFDDANLREFARLALFYESYKLRPAEIRTSWGRIRRYTSGEGLMSSRALLFPDFDYDAAQSSGLLGVPSRDVILSAEITKTSLRQEAEAEFSSRVRDEFNTAPLPFLPVAIPLHRTAIAFEEMPPPTPNISPDAEAFRLHRA